MRYGIGRRLTSGIRLTIGLTFRCNLDCRYCMLKYINGKMPGCKELSAKDWLKIIKKFPLKISEISFTGGEPFLYKDLILLLIILNKLYYITIYTNLMIRDKILAQQLAKMKKFKLDATYHPQYSRVTFEENLKYYRKFCVVNEIIFDKKPTKFAFGSNRQIKKVLIEKDQELKCMDNKRFMYTPDGTLCTSLREYITRNL